VVGSAARAPRSGEGPHAARRRAGAAAAAAAVGFESTSRIASRPTRGAPRWRTSFEGARSSWSTTSCSNATTPGGCPACSLIADGFNGFAVHLANHDVMLCAVSRAPLEKLQADKRRTGWTFPWASSFGGDFNSDFNVWFTVEQREGGVEYKLPARGGAREWRRRAGFYVEDAGGFARRSDRGHDGNRSAYICARETQHERVRGRRRRRLPRVFCLRARTGLSLGMHQWLDRAPRGRNKTGIWFRRHDEYDKRWARSRVTLAQGGTGNSKFTISRWLPSEHSSVPRRCSSLSAR
jgi:predicted dithiol-disulfide oxidoreductase (DUF899 family)